MDQTLLRQWWNQKGQGWPIQLMAAAKVRIFRYVKIRIAVNPYDPKWELYLEARLGWQLTQTRTGITPARKFRMLLHTNPTRERGECLGTRAGAWEDM